MWKPVAEWSHMLVNVTSDYDALAKKATSCIPSGWSGLKEERSCGSPSAAAVTAPHIGRGRTLWWLHLLIRLFRGWISAQMRRAEEVRRVLLTLQVLEGCVLRNMLGLRNSSAIVMKITDNWQWWEWVGKRYNEENGTVQEWLCTELCKSGFVPNCARVPLYRTVQERLCTELCKSAFVPNCARVALYRTEMHFDVITKLLKTLNKFKEKNHDF